MSATDESAAPQSDELRSWTGHRLDDLSGAGVGRIEGFYVDEASGRAEWLLARMGRFGHYTLVPRRDAVEGVGHVWVPYTRERIRKAPRINPKDDLRGPRERELLDHYELAVDGERDAELARRGDGITARPG